MYFIQNTAVFSHTGSSALYLLKISKYTNQTKIYSFILWLVWNQTKQKNRTTIHTFNYHLAAKKVRQTNVEMGWWWFRDLADCLHLATSLHPYHKQYLPWPGNGRNIALHVVSNPGLTPMSMSPHVSSIASGRDMRACDWRSYTFQCQV